MEHPIYFAQIREDSWVEKYLSDRFRPQKIICIGSGGCTGFSLLNNSLDKIICVDNNKSQFNLIRFKKAGIENYDREEFLNLLGERSLSKKSRSEMLSEMSLNCLDSELKLLHKTNPDITQYGLNHCGTTEKYYRFISKNLLSVVPELKKIFELKSQEELEHFYQNTIKTPAFETALQILLSKSSHLLFFPDFMFAKSSEDDFSRYFKNQFHTEYQKNKMSENYFFSQLISQRYLHERPQGLPPYLTERGFIETKSNINKFEIINENIITAISNEKSIDAFYLSNVFDWLTTDQIESLCDSILKSSNSGAIILFRNLLSSSPLPKSFLNHFEIDTKLSNEMLYLERSMMYRSVSVGIRK